jgi:Ankyrin repeats (3 copies)/Ankyrin repeat
VSLNVALAFTRACTRVSSKRPRALFAATMLTAAEETIDRQKALGKLLECVATELPPLVIIIILRPLPGVELARLACVHRAFHAAILFLRHLPGPRYAAPHNDRRVAARRFGRLARAALYGDLSVVKAIILLGVDEVGIPLLKAPSEPRMRYDDLLLTDVALIWAAEYRHADVVAALLDAGANMYVAGGQAFYFACSFGQVDVVELFIQHGMDMNALEYAGRYGYWCREIECSMLRQLVFPLEGPLRETPIMLASRKGHTAVVNLLMQNGATLPAP